ncbi:hypothetical protein FBU30_006620 [Linnemannia zychae]|nr:hypothetical protein FBU30_006620 [Linnemannia zychae]
MLERTPSLLVDMTLPHMIPAESALRMVRKVVQTLMYIRGQIDSTWEQLEFLLKQEMRRQEFEAQSQTTPIHGRHHDSQRRSQDVESDMIIPIKSLKEFLEVGEKTFTDLEESVYDQLYADLRQSLSQNSGPSSPRYISLALIFGSTFTTPNEQYMIRIGPLEPRSSSLAKNPEQNRLSSIANMSSEEQTRRRYEEQKWERTLVQKLMGIHIMPMSQPNPSDQPLLSSNDSHQEDLLSTIPLRQRTRTYLLTKAPAGKIFTGLFPQQQIVLHEDYPTPNHHKNNNEHITATQSCWNQGCKTERRGPRKSARWPIHHLHLFGPSVNTSELSSDSLNISGNQCSNDEMWYLVGSGIPILSPHL